MLQSLRLWNRAIDSLSRLRPSPQQPKPTELNPFDMSDALPSGKLESSSQSEKPPTRKTFIPRSSMDGLELRISQGLLDVLFALCGAYFSRGSSREAEYFAQQAQDFATSMNAPAMVGRALARKGEVQLHQGRLQEGHQSLLHAMEVLEDVPSTERADIQRLRGDYNQRCAHTEYAQQLYTEATSMLEELDGHFVAFDGPLSRYVMSRLLAATTVINDNSPRKSASLARMATSGKEVLVPTLLATVLHQHSLYSCLYCT